MSYWWVNQNQTFKHEFEGGYLWSPKEKANGNINPFYEFMREVKPGDLVFSFVDTRIRAIGIARSSAYESPKPAEFGTAGPNWNNTGWRIDVHYKELERRIRPKDHMAILQRFRPLKYSPIQASGNGNQSVYLTNLNLDFANALVGLIGVEANIVQQLAESSEWTDENRDVAVGLVEWEEHQIQEIESDMALEDTEKLAIVVARRGQGKFKENVMAYENRCRITGVDNIAHLRASHIKPWRNCSDGQERLNGSNGLLLTPSIDHLFDRGYISFENSGELLVTTSADEISFQKMGIEIDRVVNVGSFNEDQKQFLDFHRSKVFLQARLSL